MIYLLPFFNAFLLYICKERGQILNKPYTYFLENVFVYLPSYLIKVLGGCVLCSSMWMGIFEIGFFTDLVLSKHVILILAYNSISTHIIYKLSYETN